MEKISHMANGEIPQMPDACGEFLFYTGSKQFSER
jgi:hypothetical protein